MTYASFGRATDGPAQVGWRPYWKEDAYDWLKNNAADSYLPFGRGLSYGDVCLNSRGVLLDTCRLNHWISFDAKTGVLRCESGVTFVEILNFIVPQGWFLPVVPGTQRITLGGAIANDIHGKNHHSMGSFGRYVRCFELLRSDGQILFCSAHENTELYHATIGGIGLTGLITWAELTLIPLSSAYLSVESVRFRCLEEWYELSQIAHAEQFAYTVAWMDGLTRSDSMGRGVFMRANPMSDGILETRKQVTYPNLIPNLIPKLLLQPWSMKGFNAVYFHKSSSQMQPCRMHYQDFFFPLDKISNWNRMYGASGFYQYQCILPIHAMSVVQKILRKIQEVQQPSYLIVLKIMGTIASPGLLSFSMPGISLALDFQNKGEKTVCMLQQLDKWVIHYGGRVYLAKDACMNPDAFRAYYPKYEQFFDLKDQGFYSDLWQRVAGPYVS